MITLTNQREVGGCSIYRDDVNPLLFYIMPQSPRIALDENGKPIFSLVWYRRDVSKLSDEDRKTKLGGGILAVSVELATTDDQMKQITDALASDPDVQSRNRMDKDKLAKALSINTMPISDGTVTIAILAESAGDGGHAGEMVANLIGAGRVSMTGRERASFMAKLTQDGVVLLWDMIEKNLPAIRVGYDLTFNHRLDAVSMTVWCDARKSFSAVQDQWHHLSDDASWSEYHSDGSSTYTYGDDQSDNARNRIFSTVNATEYSGVNITQEAGADAVKPDEITQLTQLGNEMIKDFLTATFLEYKAGADYKPDDEKDLKTELATVSGKKYGHDAINQYDLKTWDESMSASLNYSFTSKTVLPGHLAPNDNLSNVLNGHPVNELRTQIDIDAAYYKYLDVQIVCTADFDNDPIDLVKAHLSYSGNGPQGKIDNVGDVLFQKTSVPQHFSSYLASPDQLTYKYDCEIYYKGSSDKYAFSGETNETILVLDVDKLGVLAVDVQMGVIDWDRIKQVLVKMSYGSGGSIHQTEFTLDALHQSHRWVEVIGRQVTEPYSYTVTFIDKDSQRLDQDPQTSRSKTLIVNQPLQEALKVVLVAAGSFGTGGMIGQVVVALRYQDQDNNYDVNEVFTFAKEGDSKIWTVPLMSKTLLQYSYKLTVFYSDGITREDQWRTTDNTVLPVGDPFGYRVQVLPYLLRGNTWAFGTVALSFDDPAANIHADTMFEIKDFTTPLTWHFRLGAPDRHTYKYQLTLYRAADGKEVKLTQTEESKEVLVLIPPANP